MRIDASEDACWSVPTDELLARFSSSATGLTEAEARRRRASRPTQSTRKTSVCALLLAQFRAPMTVLLFGSAILSFSLAVHDAWSHQRHFRLQDAPDACLIVLILLIGGFLGFWQELTAANAVARLMARIATRITVLRNGQPVEILLDDVVPGDVLTLRAGDVIAGDCRLLSANELCVNESALTGESFPVEKFTGTLPPDTPLASRSNTLHLGTHIVSGFATALVVAAGGDTQFGRISSRLSAQRPETGFERGIREFGELLVRIVLVITVAVFLVKVGWQNRPLVESLLVGLALAVGMTPQLLPAVTSICLAAGAKAMARKQVIVKQLVAIENLGSMTVLCSDKTGTLTEGTIQLQAARDASGQISDEVLYYAFLNATLQQGFDNPIDRAIQKSARRSLAGIEKLGELPYDFSRKRLSIHVRDNGRELLITKGAFHQVLACCTHVAVSDSSAVDIAEYRSRLDDQFVRLSESGWRVLGLALRETPASLPSPLPEEGMTFLGFLVFADPPRSDARQTLNQLRDLGIRLKIITGDNRGVAASLSRSVGMIEPEILAGADLKSLAPEDLARQVHLTDIFAEIEPSQKEQIVRALRGTGAVVGYLGDGINDAPALHAADVGISVASAVDVAREAAQIVLLQQNLAVLVEGVREGRRTFANTLKYLFFAIAANFGYMFSLAVASMILPFEPLLAHQILLVNLLADGPAMALATDSVDPEQVHRPRRWDLGQISRFMVTFGLTSSAFDFATFGALYVLFGRWNSGTDAGEFERLFQTGWFLESTLTGLIILAVIRTSRPLYLSRPGPLFLGASAAAAVTTLLIPLSPLAGPLGFIRPPIPLIGVVILITALYGVGMEGVKSICSRSLLSPPRDTHLNPHLFDMTSGPGSPQTGN